jgi:hypothetical protein
MIDDTGFHIMRLSGIGYADFQSERQLVPVPLTFKELLV